jgi:hypothetical protein
MKKIPLTGISGKGLYAIVDDYDYDYLRQWGWYVVYKSPGGPPYAVRDLWKDERTGNIRHVAMHRIVLGVCDKDLLVDHINHDTLDNRKSNLRITNSLGNSRNSLKRRTNLSGYKGVSWSKPTNKWRARIMIEKKEVMIGLFTDKLEAARAYDKAALEHFGEFAHINFPETAPGRS